MFFLFVGFGTFGIGDQDLHRYCFFVLDRV